MDTEDLLNKLRQGFEGLLELMTTPYEERVVDRFDSEDYFVSTAFCGDLEPPFQFEKAICHKKYDEGKVIPVESYTTKEEAQEGHNKWCKTMENPPAVIEDSGHSHLGSLVKEINGSLLYERETHE
jgi:hypothetical protein